MLCAAAGGMCKQVEKGGRGLRGLTLKSIVLDFRLISGQYLARIFLCTTELLAASLIQEFLKYLARILLSDDEAGGLNDITTVVNDLLTV